MSLIHFLEPERFERLPKPFYSFEIYTMDLKYKILQTTSTHARTTEILRKVYHVYFHSYQLLINRLRLAVKYKFLFIMTLNFRVIMSHALLQERLCLTNQ